MLKLKMLLFFVFLCTLKTYSQNSFSPKITSGIVYADITSKRHLFDDSHQFRRGWFLSLEEKFKLSLFSDELYYLDIGLNYQERMPLEFFEFDINETSRYIILNYPTHPQHEYFSTIFFTRFPNFQYLNVEITPNITFGKKIKTSIGIGLFGGLLVNSKETTRTPVDFLSLEETLKLEGVKDLEYNKYDFGVLPKIDILYTISKKINIGLQVKTYYSLIRLNNSGVDSRREFNQFWLAYSGGLSLQYLFG